MVLELSFLKAIQSLLNSYFALWKKILTSEKILFQLTDKEFEKQLRPLSFSDFKGQKQVIDNLDCFCNCSKTKRRITRSCTSCMVLRDLGKTTLATIIANELAG